MIVFQQHCLYIIYPMSNVTFRYEQCSNWRTGGKVPLDCGAEAQKVELTGDLDSIRKLVLLVCSLYILPAIVLFSPAFPHIPEACRFLLNQYVG